MPFAYRIQVNNTKHMIEVDENGKHIRYVPLIDNLDLPVTYTKKYIQTYGNPNKTNQTAYPEAEEIRVAQEMLFK